jgi:copper transport protein
MRARLVALVLALALALPASAGAHAFLQASTPQSGASLARAPGSVSLLFTEPVSAALAHVALFDGRGRALGEARIVQGRTPSELRISLPQLATGAYRITYSTVSQDDLHATRGEIVFGAGTVAPHASAPASATPGTSIAESAAHLFDLIALSILIAVCALLAGALPAAVRTRVTRFASVSLPFLLLAGIVALAGKTSQLPLGDVLTDTAWGHAMLVRELAIVAVLIALVARRRRVAVALLLPVAAAEAASGHAASLDAFATLTMALHILAGGLWVGGLIVLALVLPGLERRDVLEALGRFGRIAAASVAVLVVTGLYSAGLQVANLDALLTTTYGWSLVGKVAVLGAAGALGLLGLLAVRRMRPSLRLLRAEAIAAIGILAAASLLLSSAPARGPQFMPGPRPIEGTALANGRAADLLVDLSTAPNRPGQNFVTATILDTLRPSPGPVRRVVMTFSRRSLRVTAPAARLDGNRWQVAGTQLSAPGSWRIAVAVERDGLPRATYATPWSVATPLLATPRQSAQYSRRPLQPILTALAIALATATVIAVLWRMRARLTLRRPRTA